MYAVSDHVTQLRGTCDSQMMVKAIDSALIILNIVYILS